MSSQNFEAAIVGRFQPFHNGHLAAVKQILAENKNVLIIIGSAEKTKSSENPYSFYERKNFIKTVLKAENVSEDAYLIVGLDDIGDDSRWVDYLIESVPKFKKMYTGSQSTRILFELNGKLPVADIVMLNGVSGTLVREKLKKFDSIEEFVHPALQKMIVC